MASEAKVNPGKLAVSAQVKKIYSIMMFIGLAIFVVGLIVNQERIWQSYLTSYFYFTSLALGGLFFAAIQHATNAGWSVNVRRVPEAFSSFLPIAAVAGLVLMLAGIKHLYPWLDEKIMAEDHILHKKAAYLNSGFFWVRMVVYFVAWTLFARALVGNSLKQDVEGDKNLTWRNGRIAIGFLITFALTYSLFSVDLMMSLQPHWFSTIFGVYCFSGLFQSSLAFMIIITVWLMKNGHLRGFVNENHLHDLGKYLFAFTVFYAYIAFSQFMLIWYANLPEETEFYLHRAHSGWMGISMFLLIGKFIVPFFALLPQRAKRNGDWLVIISGLILVMQFVEFYWIVYPNFNDGHVVFSIWEIGPLVGFLGLFLYAVFSFLGKNNIVPIKDPRIDESIHHHVTY